MLAMAIIGMIRLLGLGLTFCRVLRCLPGLGLFLGLVLLLGRLATWPGVRVGLNKELLGFLLLMHLLYLHGFLSFFWKREHGSRTSD